EHIEAEMPHLAPNQHDAITRMMIVRGSAEVMHARGAQYGWTFAQVEELRKLLTQGLVGFIQAHHLTRAATNLELEKLPKHIEDEIEVASDYLTQFTSKYIPLVRRRQGPFVGCTHCAVKCVYRPDVNTLLSVKDRKRIHKELTNTSHTNSKEHYGAIGKVAAQIVEKWLGEGDAEPTSVSGISYCAALHVAAAADFNEYEQALVGDRLKRYILDVE